jgi:hypothetical protein
VAAGTVRRAGNRSPVFNGLQVRGIADGLVTLVYDGYRPPRPDDVFQTIVKVLPVFLPELRSMLAVNFVSFEREGFIVRVTDVAGTPVPERQLNDVELMVEVSQYVPLRR